jgi:hypothetical protein
VSGLLPDQIAVLAQVINQPAVLCASRIGASVDQIDGFFKCLMKFLLDNRQRLASRAFSIVVDLANHGTAPLSLQNVLSAVAAGRPLLRVDTGCRYLSSDVGVVTATAAQQRTASSGLEVVVHGTYAYFVAGGRLEVEYDFVEPAKGPPIGHETFRSIHNFKGLLSDHVEFDVRRQKSFLYWAASPNRILLSKPEKTEKIFQRALLNWLDSHVADKIRIVAETRSFGQDPADVLVVTDRGDHLIEVKWLGKNDAGTSWGQDRIDEGLVQVGEYLKNDSALVRAHLVVYDARHPDEHANESTWNDQYKHGLCTDPEIVFLDNESVSQRAAATVRKAKKAAKKKAK